MQGIYKITNNINNKIYIGKTNNSDRRWNDHKRIAFQSESKEYNKALYQAIRKYGIENFSFEIIEELIDYNISGEREQYWISYFDSYNNGYNETLGGDGGSQKGHCSGENNGRAILTENDIIFIRTKFLEGYTKNEVYQYFKDKITENGFAKIWTGKTWKNIMPEIYTEENIQKNASKGKSLGGIHRRLFDNETILKIREYKNNGYKQKEIWQKYFSNINYSTFKDIWNNRTYKEVK